MSKGKYESVLGVARCVVRDGVEFMDEEDVQRLAKDMREAGRLTESEHKQAKSEIKKIFRKK